MEIFDCNFGKISFEIDRLLTRIHGNGGIKEIDAVPHHCTSIRVKSHS